MGDYTLNLSTPKRFRADCCELFIADPQKGARLLLAEALIPVVYLRFCS
jgi:hypothetical protein